MNYDFILHEKPLPHYFKKVAYIISTITLISGLYLKIIGEEDLFGMTSKDHRFWFLAAIVILIFSKPKIADERNTAIQLQLFRLGFRYLVALIVLVEINASLFDNIDSYKMFYYYATTILGTLAVLSELFLNTNIADIAEKNRGLYNLSVILTILCFIWFHMWLW
jgi:hypothetical protein